MRRTSRDSQSGGKHLRLHRRVAEANHRSHGGELLSQSCAWSVMLGALGRVIVALLLLRALAAQRQPLVALQPELPAVANAPGIARLKLQVVKARCGLKGHHASHRHGTSHGRSRQSPKLSSSSRERGPSGAFQRNSAVSCARAPAEPYASCGRWWCSLSWGWPRCRWRCFPPRRTTPSSGR